MQLILNMTIYLKLISFMLIFNIYSINGEEVFATINTWKPVSCVHEKFISVVIDPMILLSGLNISDTTLNLARHLHPAFIRLHGPSTPSFIFSNDELADTEERLTVTPDMWTSLNEWIITANLTAVFALSDRERVNEAWNARTILPLMELADKMNLNCYWELGNDLPNKTINQYVNDIESLLHIQDAFPKSNKKWKTVAGDISKMIMKADYESVKRVVHSLTGKVKAINWNPVAEDGHDLNAITKYVMVSKPKIPIWTNAPRYPDPTSFMNGLLWAKYLGDAAKQGYEVVFRQPKIREFFEITPSYWITLLHKHLMGRNVLEIRTSNAHTNSKTYMYAHCSKRQNSYTRRGAATLFMVNMQDDAVNGSIKFVGNQMKNVEIQSYILTSPDEYTSTVMLNGELLSDVLPQGYFNFIPKVRRAHVTKYLTVTLPPKSVGFFVLPSARLQACIHGEEELEMIKEEIYQDQREMIPSNELVEEDKISQVEKVENLANMNGLYKMMEEELESNERYYKDAIKRKEWRELLIEKAKEEKNKMGNNIKMLTNEERDAIINKAKLMDRQKKYIEQVQRDTELKVKKMLENNAKNDNTPDQKTNSVEEEKKIEEINKDIEKLLNKSQNDLLKTKFGEMTLNNIRTKRDIVSLLSRIRNGKNNIILKPKNSVKITSKNSESEETKKLNDNYDYVNDSSNNGESKATDELNENELKHETKDHIHNLEDDKIIIDRKNPAENDDISLHLEEGRHMNQEYFENFEQNAENKRNDLKGFEISEVIHTDILPPKETSPKDEKKSNNKELMAEEIKKLRKILKIYDAKSSESQSNENSMNTRSKREISSKADIKNKFNEKRLRLKTKVLEHKANLEAKLKARKAKFDDKKESNRIKRFVINVPEEHDVDIPAEIYTALNNAINIETPFLSKSEIITEYIETENNNINDSKVTENPIYEALTCPLNYSSEDRLPEFFEGPIILLVGKPVDLSKIVIDERKKQMQLKLLKSRLARRKQMEERRAKYSQLQENIKKPKFQSFAGLIDIRKRRSIDNYLINSLDKRYNYFYKMNEISKDEDKTKEAKILFNDISKEGKMITNFLKEADDDIYKLLIPKRKSFKTETLNPIFLNKQMDEKIEFSTKTTLKDSTDKTIIDLNLYNPSVKKNLDPVKDSLAKDGKSSTIAYDKNYTIADIENGLSNNNNLNDMDKQNHYYVPKFTVVNDLFDTLSNILSNFHNKVVNYAVYLTE